jgi:hypothetical protein
MKPDTRNRARLEILNYITNFCLTHVWGEGVGRRGSLHGFVSDIRDEEPPQVGDLVTLQSAPTTKWYLSWLREIDTGDSSFTTRYLLESIEDGDLCWWANVGIDHLEREEVREHASWRWTDRQFAFKDRWWKVCFQDRDAYITLPIYPVFGDDYSVTLGTRTRHGFDDHAPRKTFPDWRKLTKAQMAAFYDECVASRPSKAA